MLTPNSRFGRYLVKSAIGAGGMGEVFLAEDTTLDRQVALKLLSEECCEDADKLQRFIQEAKTASALNHPNIITIFEFGSHEDAHFIASEFIDGVTLTEKLKNESPGIREVIDVSIQIVSALVEAHGAGIVHRDIKPDNVMIRANGLVKVLDFGIAKLTEKKSISVDSEEKTAIQVNTTPGMIIGTANYMSPEQAKGEEVDSRTDIFSFGVVLYEMISGQLPFEGDTPIEMIGSILKDKPKPLKERQPELEEILTRTLKKDRDKRYGDTRDLLTDLENLKKRIEFEAELERTSSTDRTPEAKTQILKADTSEDAAASETSSNANSIAVMPFEHLSSDEDNEYFCDGLAEELINALAKVERLEVAARSSSFSFKGKNANVSEISEKLKVKNVLEGSVRKAGNRLRISVQLVSAADGYQIWSERYDREMEDIFDVQDEIALAVVEALKVKLLGEEKEAVLKKYTSNAEAYQLYLKGRFFFAKRTPQGFDKAIDFYKQAIEIDSEYALAYSGVSDCYAMFGFYELMQSQEAERFAAPYLEKALEIDDSLAEIYVSKAVYQVFSWTFSTLEYYDKAISLNPKYALAYHYKASTLIFMNRFEEAIESEKKAVELEPFLAIFQASLAWWNYYARRFDETIALSLKTIEMDSNHFLAYFVLGLAYGAKREFNKSISAFQKANELNAPHIEAEIGRIYGESGQKDEALEILNKLKEKSENEYVSPLTFAKIYAGLGETEKFFEYLEKSCEEKSLRILFYMPDPVLDAYRSDPRFQSILRRMNLPIDENNREDTDSKKQTDESTEAPTVMLRQQTADLANDFPADPAAERQKPYKNSNRDWRIAGILSVLIVVFGLLGYYFFNGNATQIDSIAVMPFINESGNEDVEYLSDGMTETLISSLSNIPNLSIKARSSVFRYKGKETSPKKIGEELNVKAVLLGRVVQRGEDLALNLELVDAQSENVLWSEKFDRKMKDLTSLQSEIARDVSDKLRLKLTAAEQDKVAKTHTTNSKAQQLYLRGRFHWNKRDVENFEKAIVFFKQAIDKDPNYALAYSGLADSYALIPTYGRLRPKDYMPQAKRAAQKAIELDDALAEGHASLGQILIYYDYDWEGAEREYKKAIELNPNYPTAHHWYSEFLLQKGLNEESIKEIKTALELDPLSLILNRQLGLNLFWMGKHDEAITQLKKTLDMDPNFTSAYLDLGDSYAAKGMYRKAVENYAIIQKWLGFKQEEITKFQNAFEKGGWNGYSQAILDLALEKEKDGYFHNSSIALAYAELKDKEKVLEYLNKAFEEREMDLLNLNIDYAYDFMRDDPRFRELVKKVGIPE